MSAKNTRIAQTIIKSFILLFVTYLAVVHIRKGVLGAPSIHAFCPFGGLESLFKLILSGTYIKKIFPATLIIFLSTVLMAILLRRAFCGWICPLGTLQEYFTRLGRKLKIKQNPLPDRYDFALKQVKYVGLVFIIYFTWKTGELVFAPFDPWAAYGHLAGGFSELFYEFLIGTVFLVVGVIGSIWIPQNWCKYFCPMGAFLAILSKLCPTKIARNTDTCIDCKKCSNICPVSIDVAAMSAVESAECYDCGDCIVLCPRPGTLEYRTVRNRKISWPIYGLVAVFLFFGSIYSAKAMKIWRSGFSTIDEVLADRHGKQNPDNIRGSLSLKDLSKAFNIPLSYLRDNLDLPSSVNDKELLKNLMKNYPFRMGDVKSLVKEYLNNRNPENRHEIENSHGKGLNRKDDNPNNLKRKFNGRERGGKGYNSSTSINDLLKDESGNLNPNFIRGRMTLKEVSEAFQVPLDCLLEELKLPKNADPNRSLKELASKYSFGVNDVRCIVDSYIQETKIYMPSGQACEVEKETCP